MEGYAGDFWLAIPVERHPSGTPVHVSVPARHPSRLVVRFSDEEQVLTDACVLLCGHIGALKLLELGYTGPLVKRPGLAPGASAKTPTQRGDSN